MKSNGIIKKYRVISVEFYGSIICNMTYEWDIYYLEDHPTVLRFVVHNPSDWKFPICGLSHLQMDYYML